MDFQGSQRDADDGRVVLCVLLCFSEASVSTVPDQRPCLIAGSTYNFLVCTLYPLEALSILVKLAPKVLQSLKSLFLFCLHGFLLCKLAVVVDRSRKGCKRCI